MLCNNLVLCLTKIYSNLYFILFIKRWIPCDSSNPNGSHPDMIFNLYYFTSVICRINIFMVSSFSSVADLHVLEIQLLCYIRNT